MVIYATPPRDLRSTMARAIPTVVDCVDQGNDVTLCSARVGALNASMLV